MVEAPPEERRGSLRREPVVDDLPPELQALLASATRVEHTAPFPTPPMQGQPWDPPPGTSPELTAWIRFQLGELGMPDPRGCELRWVVLTVGDEEGAVIEVVTTAYVLPRANDTEPAFAIAWNGMLYQAAAVGEPITLDEGVVQTAALGTARYRWVSHASKLAMRERFASEVVSVASPTIGLAGLTVAGDRDLPPWSWCATQGVEPTCVRLLGWASLGRAFRAQAYGDDTLGLASVRIANANREVADRLRAEVMEGEASLFEGWEGAGELESDLVRRLGSPVDGTLMRAALASPSEHLDYLMSELDELSAAWPPGDPGWDGPIRVAIGELGLDALEGLMRATDDDRLARGAGLRLSRVSDPAWELTESLLRRHLPWATLEGCERRRSPARMSCVRAVVDAVPRVPLEGWMSVLRDDRAAERWGDAARHLAHPPPVSCLSLEPRSSLMDAESADWRDCRALDASLDDAARARLRVLLIGRLRELLAGDVDGCDLAMSLLGLGGPGVLDALRDTSHACEGSRGPCECETDLTVARAAMGDETSLPEWATRLRQTGPRIGFATPRFAPGWLWPERADVQDAIREVLAGTPIRQAVVSHVGPVLGSPAVREWILAAMRSDDRV